MALKSLSSIESGGTISGSNTVNNTQKINNITIGTGDIVIDATKIPMDNGSESTVFVGPKINDIDNFAVHKTGDEQIQGKKTFKSVIESIEAGVSIVGQNNSSYQIRTGGNASDELIIIDSNKTSNGNNTIFNVNQQKTIKIGSTSYSNVELGYDVDDASNSRELATTKWVNSNNAVPVGTVISYAGKSTPKNYLFCDGSAISRNDYKELFDVIGTDYGTGDGSTTFNLPNLIDKFIQGNITSAIERDSSIPAHYHGFGYNNEDNAGKFTAVSNSETLNLKPNSGTRDWNGSHGGGVYNGDATTAECNMITTLENYTSDLVVQPPALTMRYCIKYK